MRFFVDRSAPRRGPTSRAAVWLIVALLGALVAASPEPAAGSDSKLGDRVIERFEVRDLDRSILLQPRDPESSIRSIEITADDEVLVNGREVEPDEIEARLGVDADLVDQLMDLDWAERRAALGFWSERSTRRPRSRDRSRVDIDVPIGVGHVKVSGSGDDRVSFGRSIRLEKGESAGEVVCIACSIDVAGTASGNAVAVGGSVHVTGTVDGDAVSVGGSVRVEDGGVVDGDGVAVGGTAEVANGGEILGRKTTVGVGGPWTDGWNVGWHAPWGVFSDFGRFVAALLRTGVLALLAVLALLILRPGVDLAVTRISTEPWKAAFAGLLTQLLFFPVLILVIVVLAVSIIGIPLLILVPFALLAVVVANFVGYVGVAQVVGNGFKKRFDHGAMSAVLTVILGVVAIQGLSLFGRLMSIPGGWLAMLGFTIVGLGFFVKYVSWTIGLGAMTLAALSGDWRRPAAAATPPAPPAPPPAPPERYELESTGQDVPGEAVEPPPPPAEPPATEG